MINNFKVNDFKRLNKNICLNKINITIILPIFQNYQKKNNKSFYFLKWKCI